MYDNLPEGLYQCHETPVLDLAFLGHISSEKRVDRAIEIPKWIGMAIKIAAKVDASDRARGEDMIAPLVAKVIEDSVTGVIIDGREAAIRAAEHIPTRCRNHRCRLFEPRLSMSRLAEDSPTLYQQPIDSKLTPIYAE